MSYLPLSQAAFNISSPSSSSITQFCQSLLPIPMVPKIGAETRSPEDPSWIYSTLVAFRLLCSEAGTGGAGIFLLETIFELKVSVHGVSMFSAASACQQASYRGRGIQTTRFRHCSQVVRNLSLASISSLAQEVTNPLSQYSRPG